MEATAAGYQSKGVGDRIINQSNEDVFVALVNQSGST
jgi:hypothetical protein